MCELPSSVPTRVYFMRFGKITTRVFGSREAAEDFGSSVVDPIYQDAREPVPSQVPSAHRKDFHRVMRKKT